MQLALLLWNSLRSTLHLKLFGTNKDRYQPTVRRVVLFKANIMRYTSFLKDEISFYVISRRYQLDNSLAFVRLDKSSIASLNQKHPAVIPKK